MVDATEQDAMSDLGRRAGHERRHHVHACPTCGTIVRWALTYCSGCSWRGVPAPNPPLSGTLDDEV